MTGENIENGVTFLDTPGGNLKLEQDFVANDMLVPAKLESKSIGSERPAGEGSGDVLDILLKVTAVDTECVKFHQFPRVVLVDACRSRHGIVEIDEHCRVLCRRAQQVAKFSERERADHIAFIAGDHKLNSILAGINIEMIEPEIRHHFLQLTFAVNGSNHFLAQQLLDDGPCV